MKVVITARNFIVHGHEPMDLLKQGGFDIVDHSNLNLSIGSDEELICTLLHDADAVIAGQEPLKRKTLERCPRLKLISRRGIGYDNVDIAACKDLGITVTRTVGAVEGAVAEQVMAYLLYFARRIDRQSAELHSGFWNRSLSFGVRGRTLGLVGFGGIGKEIALRAKYFGMEVLYYCRHPKHEWEAKYDVRYADLNTLLAKSDFVSLNIPLSQETEGMFDAKMFEKMKQGSYFFNIARSRIMDELALKDALECGHLAGAAIDVFPVEPCTNSPLSNVDNVVLTPHSCVLTKETYLRINCTAVQNVIGFYHGNLEPKMILTMSRA